MGLARARPRGNHWSRVPWPECRQPRQSRRLRNRLRRRSYILAYRLSCFGLFGVRRIGLPAGIIFVVIAEGRLEHVFTVTADEFPADAVAVAGAPGIGID